jgi:hypothetical protein
VLAHAAQALADAGYGVERESLALSRDDARFFGTLTLRTPLADGVHLAVGLRSSTDKSISLGWCCGARVFCCDNLAFSAQTVIARKHTTHGIERYAEAISKVVADLGVYREYEAFRIREMQRTELSDEQAESVLLRAFEAGIVGPRALPLAVREWRSPSFPQFTEAKNAWRLYNALTFALGKRATLNPQAHAHATIRLGALVQPAPATVVADVAVVDGDVLSVC